MGNMLTAAGYNYYGTETMYSGINGRQIEVEIFFGLVYYQRLRHMVADKFQVHFFLLADFECFKCTMI